MNINVLRFDSLDSTNTEAMNQARRGAEEGLCVVARQQTAGRGRHGRTWVSHPDTGLYFSIILRPNLDAAQTPLITLMSGIAVHDALKELGLNPDIKWVNDILIGDKKIAGILAESVETPTGPAVIVGIGINLTSKNFPDEIAETATSLEAELSKRAKMTAGEVEGVLVKYHQYWYTVIQDEEGQEEMIAEWQRRSTYAIGKPVRVTLQGKIIDGTTDGLEANGALRIKTLDGGLTVVHAGDVERLRTSDQSP